MRALDHLERQRASRPSSKLNLESGFVVINVLLSTMKSWLIKEALLEIPCPSSLVVRNRDCGAGDP